MDVGANYWSLWNWHAEKAENVMSYYRQYPEMIDTIARRVGYRVRPSYVWRYEGGDATGSWSASPTTASPACPACSGWRSRTTTGRVRVGGGLDPGYPLPGKIRQAQFALPRGPTGRGSSSRRRSRSRACATPCGGPATRRSKRTAPSGCAPRAGWDRAQLHLHFSESTLLIETS